MKAVEIITRKKISVSLMCVLLYLSFCVSGFYYGRGDWGYMITYLLSLGSNTIISNSIVAFFAQGLFSFLIYEVITSAVFKMLRPRIGLISEDMRYALRFFYIAANVVIGLLSLLYLISPIISIYGSIFIPFIVTTVFAGLYIAFVLKFYVNKMRWGLVIMQLGGAYIIFYLGVAVLGIVGVL